MLTEQARRRCRVHQLVPQVLPGSAHTSAGDRGEDEDEEHVKQLERLQGSHWVGERTTGSGVRGQEGLSRAVAFRQGLAWAGVSPGEPQRWAWKALFTDEESEEGRGTHLCIRCDPQPPRGATG